jgi:hypothetical protein
MRALMIVAVLSLAFAGPSYAQKLDAKGKCHGADGKFAKADVCKGAAAPAHSYKLDAKGKCRDEKSKFAAASSCK